MFIIVWFGTVRFVSGGPSINQHNVFMISYLSANPYDRTSREVAYGLKTRRKSIIMRAAEEMSRLVKKDSVLVPMPSHLGFSTYTLDLCNAIGKIKQCSVIDALRCNEHETIFSMKKNGVSMWKINLGMRLVENIPDDAEVFLIDNVIDTGKTARSAANAIGMDCIVLAYAMTNKHTHYARHMAPSE